MRSHMMFHWSRLDWSFPNLRMKEEFEAHQYWKNAILVGVKVDQQGHYYVCIPRLAPGIPATMNRIVIQDGPPLLEAFPSWEWNEAGNVRAMRSIQGYEIDELNRIWLLDQGKIAYAPSPEGSQKLLVWI